MIQFLADQTCLLESRVIIKEQNEDRNMRGHDRIFVERMLVDEYKVLSKRLR
jgi:hypothetical protein